MNNASHDPTLAAGGGPICDPETGVCELPAAPVTPAAPKVEAAGELLYVGDPMCSWCWGVSPALRELEKEALHRHLPFRILAGGLRPGGGDAWTAPFKDFLRHHWEEIAQRSGQRFSFRLLERTAFNYDTEPACRAFIVLRNMLEETRAPGTTAYGIFASIQRRFYEEGEDPTSPAFYESICAENGLDLRTFLDRFGHPDAKRATSAEFAEVRSLGVRGFPTVLFRSKSGVAVLATGYATAAQLVGALDKVVAAAEQP